MAQQKEKKPKDDLNAKEQGRKVYLLSKHFPVDTRRKIVYIQMHYPKASDILNGDISSLENPSVKDAIFERITELLDDLPIGYHARVDLNIGDYEGYDPARLLVAFNDELEAYHYFYERETRRKWLAAILMMAVGLSLIVLNFFSGSQYWFGPEGSEPNAILDKVIEIISWAFIWEAITLIFLQQNEVKIMARRIRAKVLSVSFVDDNTKKILVSEDQEALFENWESHTFLYRVGMWMTLIASAGFIVLSLNAMLSMARYIVIDSQNPDFSAGFYARLVGSAMTISIIFIITGIAGLRSYIGHGKVLPAVSSGLSFIISLTALIYFIIHKNLDLIIPSALGLGLDVFFIFGYFCIYPYKRKKRLLVKTPEETPESDQRQPGSFE